jgi:hypothetical protein
MVGPMGGEIARLRVADLEDEACRDRRERLALRHGGDGATRPRRLAIFRRIRKA